MKTFHFELIQVNYSSELNQLKEKFTVIVDELKREFACIFNETLGTHNRSKISLILDESAKPVFFKPRPVPFAWKSKVEKQLNNLKEMGVIEQIDNSEWATPLVPILKPNGEIRICAVQDFKYPLPRKEEIFTSLQGGELFTKLDLSNAYNQLVLDEKSQLICAWSTHMGIFKVKRLSFDIKTAAAIFQKTIESLFQGLSNVVVYQDDITVTGKDTKQHLDTLKAVMHI